MGPPPRPFGIARGKAAARRRGGRRAASGRRQAAGDARRRSLPRRLSGQGAGAHVPPCSLESPRGAVTDGGGLRPGPFRFRGTSSLPRAAARRAPDDAIPPLLEEARGGTVLAGGGVERRLSSASRSPVAPDGRSRPDGGQWRERSTTGLPFRGFVIAYAAWFRMAVSRIFRNVLNLRIGLLPVSHSGHQWYASTATERYYAPVLRGNARVAPRRGPSPAGPGELAGAAGSSRAAPHRTRGCTRCTIWYHLVPLARW